MHTTAGPIEQDLRLVSVPRCFVELDKSYRRQALSKQLFSNVAARVGQTFRFAKVRCKAEALPYKRMPLNITRTGPKS
jgi:hypothetical protein